MSARGLRGVPIHLALWQRVLSPDSARVVIIALFLPGQRAKLSRAAKVDGAPCLEGRMSLSQSANWRSRNAFQIKCVGFRVQAYSAFSLTELL